MNWLRHTLAHMFGVNRKDLVWEMVSGGGPAYGLRCQGCGEIEWLDWYDGILMDEQKSAIHLSYFEDTDEL